MSQERLEAIGQQLREIHQLLSVDLQDARRAIAERDERIEALEDIVRKATDESFDAILKNLPTSIHDASTDESAAATKIIARCTDPRPGEDH